MSEYLGSISAAEQAYGLPSGLLSAQLNAESGFNPTAYNPASGASGIAQFIPSTASQFNINPLDPLQSINAAAQYDAQLYQKTGSWVGALQLYGTLPFNLNSLNPAQQQVLGIAQASDSGSGGFWSNLKNLFSPNLSVATGGASDVGIPVGPGGAPYLPGAGQSSSLSNLGLRIAVGLLALVFTAFGLYGLLRNPPAIKLIR